MEEDVNIIKKDLEVLNEFRNMLDANTMCRLVGFKGYEIINVFKSNSIIKEWLEHGKEND